MSKTLQQIYVANPITSNAATDLMYFSQSPYTAGHDAGETFANFAAQFVSSATGVTSVSGTANRITSTGGTTPIINISASYVGQSSITTLGTITAGIWNGTTIAIANGGTAVTSVTTAPAATAWAGWDASSNLRANNFLSGYNTFTTSQTLTVASPYSIYMTGSTAAQTMTLPVTSTYAATGGMFMFMNNSSQTWSINSSGANLVVSLPTNTMVIVECILITGTTAASWNAMPITYMTPLSFTNQNNMTGTVSGSNLAIAPTGNAIVNSGFASWDASGNFIANMYNVGYQTIGTSSTTTTLTVTSPQYTVFTGTSIICVLPAATTLKVGATYTIILNNGNPLACNVKDGAGNILLALANYSFVTCILTANGTTAGTWDISLKGGSGGNGPTTNRIICADNAGSAAVTGGFTIGTSLVVTIQATAARFRSNNANVAASGIYGMGSTESVSWRNNANNADILLGKNTSDVLTWPGAMSLGVAAGTTGALNLLGTTSGTVTIQPQSAAGTYNFNLPITAGSTGQVLTSQGGSSTAMTWTSVLSMTQVAAASTPITAAVNTQYYVTNASQVVFTLPATAAAGSIVEIIGNGAGGWQLLPGSGQTIKVVTASAGTSITSAEQYDCITVFCTVANTTWVARSAASTGLTIV